MQDLLRFIEEMGAYETRGEGKWEKTIVAHSPADCVAKIERLPAGVWQVLSVTRQPDRVLARLAMLPVLGIARWDPWRAPLGKMLGS